jgi:hypothetical protein
MNAECTLFGGTLNARSIEAIVSFVSQYRRRSSASCASSSFGSGRWR